jgi:intracellular sulfur oxidation DsrE/DsrF family protein
LSLQRTLNVLVLLATLGWACWVAAGGDLLPVNGLVQTEEQPPGYLGRIELNNPDGVAAALRRAESFYHGEGMREEEIPPLVLVIHGSEVGIFFKENYSQYKPIVDLAAKLAAFQVIDIRVCEASAQIMGLDIKTRFPFVGTVPYGPVEITRLIDVEKYVYF